MKTITLFLLSNLKTHLSQCKALNKIVRTKNAITVCVCV